MKSIFHIPQSIRSLCAPNALCTALRALAFCTALFCLGGSPAFAGEASLLNDRLFSHGLQVTATNVWAKPLYGKTLFATDTTSSSQWHLCQWASRFSLGDTTPELLPDGSIRCANAGMSVTWNAKQERLSLGVNGESEYQGRLRKTGEAWPHLLIEQVYDKPIRLTQLHDLVLRLHFNVTRCEVAPGLSVDPALHTAQLTAYWTVHDFDLQGRSRDMIWLGVPLFDARYEIPPPHHALDTGKADATHKFIYLIDGREFWKEPIATARWHSLDRDIMPFIKDALLKSQQQGHMTSATMESLSLTSFNLGWEVPGPYNCSVDIRELDVTARKRQR